MGKPIEDAAACADRCLNPVYEPGMGKLASDALFQARAVLIPFTNRAWANLLFKSNGKKQDGS